jgi:hypothetical protein
MASNEALQQQQPVQLVNQKSTRLYQKQSMSTIEETMFCSTCDNAADSAQDCWHNAVIAAAAAATCR